MIQFYKTLHSQYITLHCTNTDAASQKIHAYDMLYTLHSDERSIQSLDKNKHWGPPHRSDERK
jgi:hypothetical protein